MKITTEQQAPVTFSLTDGRGRPMGIDGTPAVMVSDSTVVRVDNVVQDGGAWKADVVALTPGDAHVTFTVDADLGAGVQEVIGELDVTVELDPRTGSRIVQLQAGDPVDKPA